MKIAICDDDIILHQSLAQFIQDTYRDLDLTIDLYSSGIDLLKNIRMREKHYDILLLDIEMEKTDGMTVAKELQKMGVKTHIIFITTHAEYSSAGYEVSAFRFLVKPLNKKKLLEAIEAVKAELSSMKKIHIQNRDGEFVVMLDDILYLEAQNQEILIYLKEGQLMERENIHSYEQLLCSEDFYRIHRSYLVNLKYVHFFDKKEVMLNNGTKLPISRLRLKDFTAHFHLYIRRTAK